MGEAFVTLLDEPGEHLVAHLHDVEPLVAGVARVRGDGGLALIGVVGDAALVHPLLERVDLGLRLGRVVLGQALFDGFRLLAATSGALTAGFQDLRLVVAVRLIALGAASRAAAGARRRAGARAAARCGRGALVLVTRDAHERDGEDEGGEEGQAGGRSHAPRLAEPVPGPSAEFALIRPRSAWRRERTHTGPGHARHVRPHEPAIPSAARSG